MSSSQDLDGVGELGVSGDRSVVVAIGPDPGSPGLRPQRGRQRRSDQGWCLQLKGSEMCLDLGGFRFQVALATGLAKG
jgi:hypothetical protein